MKIYNRTEDGVKTEVSRKAGMAEINHWIGRGRGETKSITQMTWTNFEVKLKDGRTLRFECIEVPDDSER